MIKQAESSKEFDDVLSLLYDYIIELNSIDEVVIIRSKEELKQEYFYDANTHFYLTYLEDKPIGLSVICTGDSCHPLADIYINEFYIIPEYRKHGYAKEMLEYITRDDDISRICFHVLKNNKYARDFWEKIMSDSWENVSDIYHDLFDDHNLIWYIFERKWDLC